MRNEGDSFDFGGCLADVGVFCGLGEARLEIPAGIVSFPQWRRSSNCGVGEPVG